MAAVAESGPDVRWLVVAATGAEPRALLRRRAGLAAAWPGATIVSSDDCANLAPALLLVVAHGAADAAEAEREAARLRARIGDAYARRCEVRPRSRLALGLPVVHESIARVPRSAGRPSLLRDAISEVVPLPEADLLYLERVFDPAGRSLLDGWRTNVHWLGERGEERALLATGCADFGGVAQGHGIVAFECATEAVGRERVHTVKLFRGRPLAPLAEQPRCRGAVIASESEIACQHESVDADGQLTLTAQRVSFARTSP